MPDRAHARPLSGLAGGLTAAALGVLAGRASAADDTTTTIELDAHMREGMRHSHDQPMVVLWLEDADGRFIRTLWRFGKPTRWYDDLTVWKAQSAGHETAAALDAVTGPTITQGDTGRLRVPRRWQGIDLLCGRYVLRGESRKDHAKHDSSLRIPLGPAALGAAIHGQGYVTELTIAAVQADAGEQPPAAPRQLPSIPPGSGSPVQSGPAPTGTHDTQPQETHP